MTAMPRTTTSPSDRQQATRAAERAYRLAVRAGLPVTMDDDTRAVTVTIRYADEADDEPDFTRLEARG